MLTFYTEGIIYRILNNPWFYVTTQYEKSPPVTRHMSREVYVDYDSTVAG